MREAYAPPWTITIPGTEPLRRLLNESHDSHIVAFHFVERGYCLVRPQNSAAEVALEPGQLAISFGGVAHQLRQGDSAQVMGLETLLARGRNIFHRHGEVPPHGTALMCGVFVLRNARLNPLLSALPPLLHTSARFPRHQHNLPVLLEMMRHEMTHAQSGGSFVIERLAEVVCADVIRAYAGEVKANQANWLGGIHDPVVGKAIALIHTHLTADWSVAQIAGEVALSPSRFAARFVAAVGVSPMTYLARWRMNRACCLLTDTPQEIAHIAAAVGYNHVTAFYRVFKRYVGVSPVQYRVQHQSEQF